MDVFSKLMNMGVPHLQTHPNNTGACEIWHFPGVLKRPPSLMQYLCLEPQNNTDHLARFCQVFDLLIASHLSFEDYTWLYYWEQDEASCEVFLQQQSVPNHVTIPKPLYVMTEYTLGGIMNDSEDKLKKKTYRRNLNLEILIPFGTHEKLPKSCKCHDFSSSKFASTNVDCKTILQGLQVLRNPPK